MKHKFDSLFEKPTKDFLEHLQIQENERILFSGIYGIGKTTFIKHFFEDSKYSDGYNAFHLFPINYSVSQNQDIFRYLKYDILFEAFTNNNVELENEDFTSLQALPFFAQTHFMQFLASFILIVPQLGRKFYKFYEVQKELYEKFQKFKDPDSESDDIIRFVDEMHNADGSPYESDIITQFIQNSLENLKGDQDKKNVLIIDDLDRIDPNHIFRLLNVFAAHFDQRNEGLKNKFGFDHVIFVCDANNIEAIYRNRFGVGVDFEGYIDKFFSHQIFKFDNKENILSILSAVIHSIKITGENEVLAKNYERSNVLAEALKYIVSFLLESNQINLRSLFKFHESTVSIKDRRINLHNHRIMVFQIYHLAAIDILFQILGSKYRLLTAIKACAELGVTDKISNYPFSSYESFLAQSIFLLSYENHRFQRMENGEHVYKLNDRNWIHYNFQAQNGFNINPSYFVTLVKITDPEIQNSELKHTEFQFNFFDFLQQSVELLIDKRFFD